MSTRFSPATRCFTLLVSIAIVTLATPAAALADRGSDGRTLFLTSAVENPDDTVTLPLYRGITADGREVWYIILDSSDGKSAVALGVNHAPKLNNVRGTAAVQTVQIVDKTIVFGGTVDFTPERVVVPGPEGFPPDAAEPGARGDDLYSPLIELPDGTVLNAPHVANDSGQADKVVDIDFIGRTVTYQETHGLQGGKAVKYVSTDASFEAAAALENVTYAPALNAAPTAGADGTDVARASLVAFVNGQTGATNPERQGLNSALLDGLEPLNILRWNPSQGRYSPLWDVFLAEWSPAIATDDRPRQDDFGDVRNLAKEGLVTGPGGAPFGPAGFVVNCPIVSSD